MKVGQVFRCTIIYSSTMLLKKCDINGKNLHFDDNADPSDCGEKEFTST